MDGWVWDRPPLGLGLAMALDDLGARAPLGLWSEAGLAGQAGLRELGRAWKQLGSTRMRPWGELLHVDSLSLSLSCKPGRAAKPGGFLHSEWW